MKQIYKPARQKLYASEDGKQVFYFCHGKNLLGRHVDIIMKSYKVIPENELLMAHEPAFVHSLCYLREATNTEIIEHCI